MPEIRFARHPALFDGAADELGLIPLEAVSTGASPQSETAVYASAASAGADPTWTAAIAVSAGYATNTAAGADPTWTGAITGAPGYASAVAHCPEQTGAVVLIGTCTAAEATSSGATPIYSLTVPVGYASAVAVGHDPTVPTSSTSESANPAQASSNCVNPTIVMTVTAGYASAASSGNNPTAAMAVLAYAAEGIAEGCDPVGQISQVVYALYASARSDAPEIGETTSGGVNSQMKTQQQWAAFRRQVWRH